MYHLKLCRGISYSNGEVSATRKRPDVFVDSKETADAAVASGYFKLVGEQETTDFPPAGDVLGNLDPEQLDSMTIPDLKKLAGKIGADIKGIRDKAGIIKAITAVKVSAPAFDAEALATMSDEDLKALVEEKGIDLTGCETREDALEAISAALGGSYTMLDLMSE
jgi:hypothetical protein